MRVSDVLEMLAGGATPAEIAADFLYLTEDDVRAVPAYTDRDVADGGQRFIEARERP